jgi:MFS family permease
MNLKANQPEVESRRHPTPSTGALEPGAAMIPVLSKERIVAGPGFNRWWNVVAALAINLCIGQAYAFSVFNLPLSRLRGGSEPAPGDWTLSQLGWIFTLAYVFLGLSAGVAGKWQDRVGPRASGVVAALCFGGGFFLSALGVRQHQIAWLYFGYGILGGCGLGLGFNTPISTLLRWFPDRRGLATGAAVMGFGGGAILAAPMSTALIRWFATSATVGVAEAFVVLGTLYTSSMLVGAFLFRLPPPGYRPAHRPSAATTAASLTVEQAVRTRAFLLLWCVLLLNVTAGLGVLGQAAAMIQEVFDGVSAETASLFVALLSLFNMSGRLVWAWVSDRQGRKATYALFFSLGPLLYAAVPLAGEQRSLVLFVACFALLLSMYGGGFGTMPAYVADLFGASHAGAIHGRVLTALSAAGLLGPTLVNYLREHWIAQGYSKARAYDATLYIMAGLLVVGYLCNRSIRPADAGGTPQAEPEPEMLGERG